MLRNPQLVVMAATPSFSSSLAASVKGFRRDWSALQHHALGIGAAHDLFYNGKRERCFIAHIAWNTGELCIQHNDAKLFFHTQKPHFPGISVQEENCDACQGNDHWQAV